MNSESSKELRIRQFEAHSHFPPPNPIKKLKKHIFRQIEESEDLGIRRGWQWAEPFELISRDCP